MLFKDKMSMLGINNSDRNQGGGACTETGLIAEVASSDMRLSQPERAFAAGNYIDSALVNIFKKEIPE